MRVGKDPLNRYNHGHITAFITEVKIVQDSLQRQHDVVDKVDDDCRRQKNDWVGGSYNAGTIRPPDPAQLILQDTLDALRGKITSIEELLEKSETLLEFVS